jgi:hypothetical protein
VGRGEFGDDDFYDPTDLEEGLIPTFCRKLIDLV